MIPCRKPGRFGRLAQNGALVVFAALMASVFSPLRADTYPERPIQLVVPAGPGSNISSTDQEAALRENIASVRVTHLEAPYAMLGMLQPKACAGLILNFAAANDGIVCRD
jgi:hypothetical protein